MSVNRRSGSLEALRPAGTTGSVVGYRPLYRQVKDILIRRLGEGSWIPGQVLPSEPEIAAELGVSPGTVRKALDEMTAQNLLVRRQGRGTFVARHDEDRILFQFFRLVSDAGERRFPESRVVSVATALADEVAAERLTIALGASIVAIERVRSLDGRPCIHEWINLPAARFPGIERRADLPNNLYALYSTEYGVTISGGTEGLKAVPAKERQVELLDARLGEPLLSIDRLALGLEGAPAEWRRSLCRTDLWTYTSELK